ncbi:MAG: hypothetical protein ACREDM_08005 [Methylocella sp.]
MSVFAGLDVLGKRTAMARKLAVLLGRVWKDGARFDAVAAA